jgi:hypothetical protein
VKGKTPLRRVWIAAGPALAVLAGALLTLTGAASASSSATVSPRDNCGGFNGHVDWSSSSIRLYGQVWDVNCSGGTTEVWLSWNGSVHNNLEAGSAVDPHTEGVNFTRSTNQTPTDIGVTVCSTKGGWHCGAGVSVSTGSGPTTTTTTTVTTTSVPPTTTTVVTVPVPTPVPQPTKRSRVLDARLALRWTWNVGHTWLEREKLGRVPARTGITVRCVGAGCPRPLRSAAHGERRVRRVLHGLLGHRYRTGDRLLLTLTAPGWKPERVQVTIRTSHKPGIRLLRD